MTVEARRRLSSLPSKTRSETTISYRPPDTPSLTDDSQDDSDDEDAPEKLTMSPAELRIIRRLSARVNILPVVGHADSLTDAKLKAVKATPKAKKTDGAKEERNNGVKFGEGKDEDGHAGGEESDEEETEKPTERTSRPVIKLRTGRSSSGSHRSRSRSRLELASEPNEPEWPDFQDRESVANLRFSAAVVARGDLSALLPFALIAPEHARRRRAPASILTPSDDGHANGHGSPVSPSSRSVRNMPYLQAPPEELKGVFTRAFRWGSVDVLDPTHCDFAAMRTAVLSTHTKILKTRTKEVLYEKYRTEKLLARRATQKFGEEETKRLLEGESRSIGVILIDEAGLIADCSAFDVIADLGL
ncbi:hypothetical protein EW146_g1914 [Bondarzewia mesenterica]|uniref:Septin-type G domain-containing protein n=1 Tax=Bondarzewia mesenterica TaxID=1095465 RepID=A0A4S4M2C0_9AGAM|nr:hypothetical protein EW146_g1914 [Bondarzewia mesenterica]